MITLLFIFGFIGWVNVFVEVLLLGLAAYIIEISFVSVSMNIFKRILQAILVIAAVVVVLSELF